MPNERLSLEIAATTAGQADVQKLNQTLSETGSTSERSGKSLAVLGERATTTGVSLAAMTRELTRHSEASQTARAAAAALATTLSAAAVGIAQHSAAIGSAGGAVDELANGYRVLRLALSPTIFTASTLAVGLLVEESLKLVAVRGKLIEQQSLLAATSGLKFSTIDRIDTTSRLSGANSENITAALSSLQQNIGAPKVQGALSNLNVPQYLRGSASPELLAELAKKFADLPDPVKRAQAAIDLFGADLAGKVLPDLNTRFADSAKAVNDWGLALDDASRNQIYRLSRDLGSLKNEVLGLAVPFESLGQKIALSLELGAAKTYDFLQSLRTVTEFQRRNAADKSANQPNSPAEANALFSFAAGAAARNMNASTDGLNSLLLQKPAFSLAEADNNTRAGLESRLARQRARRDSAADALDRGGLSNDDTRNFSSEMIAASRAVKSLTDQLQSLESGRRQNQALLSSRDILTQSAFEPSAGRDLQQHIQHASEYVDTDGNVQKFRLLDETRRNLEAAFHAYVLDLGQKAAARDIALDEENFAKRTALAETYWKRQQAFQDETARTEISTINNRFAQENTLAGYRRDESLGALPEPYVSTVGSNTPGQQGRNQFRLTQQQLANIGSRRDIQSKFVTDTSIDDAETIRRAQEAALIGIAAALKAGNVSPSDASARFVAINESAGQQSGSLNDKFTHDITAAQQTAARETVDAIRQLQDGLAEIEEKKSDEFASTVVSGFDVVTQRFGRALATRNFLEGQGRSFMNEIVSNAAKDLFGSAPIQTALKGLAVGDTSKFPGNLLSGTFLGKNSLPLDKNTAALEALTAKFESFVTGGTARAGGTAGNGLPGVLGNLTGAGGPGTGGDIIPAADWANFASGGPGVQFLTANDDLPLTSSYGQMSSIPGLQVNPSMVQSSLGTNVAMGVTAGLGAFTAAQDFSRGNAAGAVGGVGALAGTAGALVALAGVTGPAAPILAGIGATLGILGSFLGKGPQQRAQDISNSLQAAQYIAPTALNLSENGAGDYVSMNAHGMLNVSNYRAAPQVTEGYTWAQTHGLLGGPPSYYNVPGRTLTPFSPWPGGANGPASVTPIQIHIHAADASSFVDMANRNAMGLADALATHLQTGYSRLHTAVQSVAGTR